MVVTPLRLSSFGGRAGPIENRGRLTFIKVFCFAQLAMVVANLGRIPVLSTEDRDFPLAFNELCLLAVLGAALLSIRHWEETFLDNVSLTALLFAAIGALSAIWSLERFDLSAIELIVSLAYLGRWMLYFALYVALINVLREGNLDQVWDAVETMLVAMAVFGMFQAAFLPNFAQMVYPDNRSFNWDEQRNRLISTVLEPNVMGTMFMMGVLVQVGRASTGASVRWWRLATLFAGMTLTISRTAAVGLFFGLIVVLVAQGLTRRLVKIAGAALVIVALAAPLLIRFLLAYNKFSIGEGSSAAARIEVWLQTVRVIVDYPLFGIGFNTYRYAMASYGVEAVGASSYSAEGGLLYVMAMTGAVGLFVYLVMTWQIMGRCRALWRDASVPANQRGMAIGAAASTVGVIIASIFTNVLLTTFVMEILWVLWAITFVAARAQRDRTPGSTDRTSTRLVAFSS
jgi:hypothetical protein